jgi:hypothetical protein
VRLHAFAAIGLKCALGHENALLFPRRNLSRSGRQVLSVSQVAPGIQRRLLDWAGSHPVSCTGGAHPNRQPMPQNAALDCFRQ